MTTADTVDEAVRRWWAAFEDRDPGALGSLVHERCTFVGGPGGRQRGREEFLAGAEDFFAAGEVSDWQIDGLTIDLHGDTAVATYAWTEHGTHGAAPFALDGIATDVYRRAGDVWVMIARHVGTGQLR